jgi:predicted adenylyl cyclase CyaB
MARNIEIKARVSSTEALAATVSALADAGPIELVQNDTFFRCPSGRLKLRVLADGQGELIFYRRADRQGPKESFYIRSPTSSPETLQEALSLAYGEIGHVRKRRILFVVGRTRIHLDQVEDLGNFVEIEVVLAAGEDAQKGVVEARSIMSRLGINQDQVIEGAYVDLLAAGAERQLAEGRIGLE